MAMRAQVYASTGERLAKQKQTKELVIHFQFLITFETYRDHAKKHINKR